MNVTVLVVPYDSGLEGERMGAGPRRLLNGGLAAALEAAGHALEEREIGVPGGFRAEVGTGFELYRRLAVAAAEARRAGRLPLVLSGNCGATLGALAGLAPPDDLGLLWLDAHGDFHTPDTTESGFLDGMALAAVTGRCWRTLAASVPGFRPLPASRVVHVGGQQLDPAEGTAMRELGMPRVPAASVREAGLAAAVDAVGPGLLAEARRLYAHLDADVLDAERVGPANGYAAAGGLDRDEVEGVIARLRAGRPLAGLTVASYDPSVDGTGRVLDALVRIVGTLLEGAA